MKKNVFCVCRFIEKLLLRMKCKSFFYILLSVFLIGVAINFILPFYYTCKSPKGPPVIIWWTPNFPGESHKKLECEHSLVCTFTNNRNLRVHENVAGFLFYGSDFNFLDLPLPRRPQEYVWGLLHEESPRNTPILSHAATLQLFNYSSTISRHSDVPLTLQYLYGVDDLLTLEYYLDTFDKNKLLSKISPVLYLQSDCDTSSDRDEYVNELMKHIPVDSYGVCLNNKKLPEQFSRDYLNDLNANDFLQFVGQYKFTIAFENGICDDYITEKLWRPLKVGSVPIYMGSPSVRDWLPNERSAIIVDEFESPRKLAEFIQYLNTNDDYYQEFLLHKINGVITNKDLIRNLNERIWTADNTDYSKKSFVDAFECLVCENIYKSRNGMFLRPSVVDKSHYDCAKPVSSIPHRKHSHEWWIDDWETSRKQAAVLTTLLINEKRQNYSEVDFYNMLSSNDID